MLKKGQYFSEQVRNEQIVLFTRTHWFSFTPWALILLAMTIVPVIIMIAFNINVPTIFSNSSKSFWILGISTYSLITLAVFLTAWINFYLNVLILTPEHLVDIHQAGLFNRKVAEQSLLRVQDVSSRVNGVFQTFFRYGTVLVQTAGDNIIFEMHNIPNPNKVANQILKLHEDLIESTGVNSNEYDSGIKSSVGKVREVKNALPVIKEEKVVNHQYDNSIKVSGTRSHLLAKEKYHVAKIIPEIIDHGKRIIENNKNKNKIDGTGGDLKEGELIKF